MKKEFVTQYLILNGKHLPKDKLNEIGEKLEFYEGIEYAINIQYVSTLKGVLYTWLFTPFDRLLLKDKFYGTIKLLLFLSLICVSIIYHNTDYTYFHIPFSKESLQVDTDIIIAFFLFSFIIWQILDIVTVHWRIRNTNYKKLLGILETNTYKKPTIKGKNLTKENSSKIKQWMLENPNKTINDYYRLNRK